MCVERLGSISWLKELEVTIYSQPLEKCMSRGNLDPAKTPGTTNEKLERVPWVVGNIENFLICVRVCPLFGNDKCYLEKPRK